jgi:cytochrome b561
MQDLDAFWGEDWPQDLHELLANALILVACLHVAAVLWIHFVLKTPLLHRMWFGRNYNTKVGPAGDV